MIKTSVRHPRLVAAVAGLCAMVMAIALIGPRDSGLVGVGDAGATDGADQTSSSTTQPGDDGVVLTAPGELVTVIEGPTPTSDGGVGVAGPPPASSVAPSADTTVVVAGEIDGEPVTTGAEDPVATDAAPTTAQPATSGPATSAVTAETSTTTSAVANTPSAQPLGENTATVVDAASNSVSEQLLAAPTLSGIARGSTIQPEPLIAQVGTRDANSVPWMLLIAANFGIATFALALLRLRR